jgi:tetratricopeptide (TPR) repeat protein
MFYFKDETGTLGYELERALHAAEGYLYLGMPDEALRELDEADEQNRSHASLLRSRVRVLLHLKRWKEAESLSVSSSMLHPNENEFMVQRAFALHQMKRGNEAVGVLLSAPEWIRRTGILHYNLACYEAKLGDLGTARQCIRAAVELNSAFKRKARTDPDLERLWS